jgi:polyisoprenoid-binding protein YceI
MSRLTASVVVLMLLATPRLTAASTWEIDPAHSNAQFAVRHLVISTVRGQLGKVTGVVQLDDSDVTKSSVQATVDATAINTREAKRDEDLRGPDFLDVAKFPTITFASKKVEQVAADRYKVTGDLTMHGVTKEVTLDVQGSPQPLNDPFGNVKLGGVATTRLNRQDFGIAWSKALDGGGVVVGDDVDVTIDLEVTKK